MTPALATRGIGKRFGAFEALNGVTIALEPGARHALIGPNGAGKTTLINILAGALAPSAGDVFLDGERVTRLRQHARVDRGLARTFQINQLFPGLTVLESVLISIFQRKGIGTRALRRVDAHVEEIAEAHALLATLRLDAQARERTAHLAYGKRRLLEIALAMATRPRILLLDEPAAGIASAESVEVLAALAALPRDVTLLFIEHDMGIVFRFAERITVLVGGRVLMEGGVEDVRRDERVRAVYLGRTANG
jgi:branched-chain amino acid transport system ATP-binding protein